ncbi:TPA: hypothetical protein RG908_001952 [Klebsiella aerogenes]|uniref:Uncharacterized protein n=1 Tax=Klebsiella aerogenes TaxID=548 RepID=A0AAW9E5Q1_KLEAE|nr:hypothetical protein [Klebsiella aerogenes]CCG31305.1 hypothetical protein [Klebsiella aerogenes EA1509E]EIV3803378.1 hypothetical protein [Klebsiella aerogenes]EIV7214480.1 hypothetical protein [Klebsiella aerogenes]EKU4980227.1 hypothetical protein [Klebsiella aerogenes]EKU8925341.1 hypothetical protein [Klebsiella aerogenes]
MTPFTHQAHPPFLLLNMHFRQCLMPKHPRPQGPFNRMGRFRLNGRVSRPRNIIPDGG